MEKISGIVPSSHRTRAIDVSKSQPVRPGAPAWGRPMGRVTAREVPQVEDQISFTRDQSSELMENLPGTYNARGETANVDRGDSSRVKLVEELSKKFFDAAQKPEMREAAEAADKAQSRVLQSASETPETFSSPIKGSIKKPVSSSDEIL